MAQASTGPVNLKFVNATKTNPTTGTSGSYLTTGGNYVSINAMRTRLQAVNATYYTNARLDSMTVNDMVFAMRNVDDAATIASYMTNSTA